MKTILILTMTILSFNSFTQDVITFSGQDNDGKTCSITIQGNGSTLLAQTSYNDQGVSLSLSKNGSDYLQEFNLPTNVPVFHGMIGKYDDYQGIQVHLLPIIKSETLVGFSAFTYKDNTGVLRALRPVKKVCKNLK